MNLYCKVKIIKYSRIKKFFTLKIKNHELSNNIKINIRFII